MPSSLFHFTLLSLPLLVIAQTTQPSVNCTTFTWDTQPSYLLPILPPQRISAALTCPPSNPSNNTVLIPGVPTTNTTISHSCPLSASGDIQFSFTYNVSRTVPDGSFNLPSRQPTSFLYELMHRELNKTLNESGVEWVYGAIGAVDTTVRLGQGESGYLNFTGLRRCFVGNLGNCSGGVGSIGVEACAPVYHTLGGRVQFDGETTIVNVSAEDVAANKFPDPFRNQVGGDKGGDGVRVGTSVMLMGALVGVAMMVLC